MIAQGYLLERAFRLTFYSLSFLYYFSQVIYRIYRSRQLRDPQEDGQQPQQQARTAQEIAPVKSHIHNISLLCSFCQVIASTDPGPIFNTLPPLLFHELEEFSSVLMAGIFCLVISSHFEAHYIVLRKEYPKHLKYLFLANVILLWIEACFITDIGSWATGELRWIAYGFCGAFLFITLFMALDIYGYCLIRRMLLAHSRPDKRLRRITIFHVSLLTVLSIFDVTLLLYVIGWVQSGEINGPIAPKAQGEYDLDFTILITPCCLVIFGWWAFTPPYCLSSPLDESRTQISEHVPSTHLNPLSASATSATAIGSEIALEPLNSIPRSSPSLGPSSSSSSSLSSSSHSPTRGVYLVSESPELLRGLTNSSSDSSLSNSQSSTHNSRSSTHSAVIEIKEES